MASAVPLPHILSLPWPPIYGDQNTRNLPKERTEIKRSMSGLQTGPLKGCPHFHRNRYARVTCLGQPPNLASPSPRGRRTTSTTLSRPKSPIPPPKTITSAAAAAQPSTRRQPILRPPTPTPTSPPPALRCLFSRALGTAGGRIDRRSSSRPRSCEGSAMASADLLRREESTPPSSIQLKVTPLFITRKALKDGDADFAPKLAKCGIFSLKFWWIGRRRRRWVALTAH